MLTDLWLTKLTFCINLPTYGYYYVIFQACLRHSFVPSACKGGTGIFLPKRRKESFFEAKFFPMITLTSFQLKWLERLILHNNNEDNKVQANLFASQYGFRAGIFTETDALQ